MFFRSLTLTSAIALAALIPAGAAELHTHPAFSIPAVIGAGFHDAVVATTPWEVQSQGGYTVPAAGRFAEAPEQPKSPAAAPMASFIVPPVIGAAFHEAAIATTPDEVQRQRGYSVPVMVKWMPTPPTITVTKAVLTRVGAL